MPKKNSLLSTICTFVVVSLLLFAFSRFLKLPLKADDTEGPEIVAWAIMPEEIDTDGKEVEITLYLRIKAPNEVDLASQYHFFRPDGVTETSFSLFSFELMTNEYDNNCQDVPKEVLGDLTNCGTTLDGIFKAYGTLPPYSYFGKWELFGNIKDKSGKNLVFEELEDNYRPSFVNKGEQHDSKGPEIKSFKIDKTNFDTSEENVTLTITMELEDDLSGINTSHYQSQLELRSVLEWNPAIESGDLKPVDGKPNFFTTEITIPKGSKPGFWSFTNGNISDLTGNRTNLSEEDFLEYIGEKYLANTVISNQVTIADSWWLEGGYLSSVSYDGATKVTSSWPSVVIIFQEGTIVTKQGGGNFGIHRMVSESYITEKYKTLAELLTEANEKLETDIKKCHESEGCVAEELTGSDLVGNPINIGKVGLPGLGLSFSKPATVILAVDEKYLGQTLEVQTFDGTKWVKIGSCLVKTFDPLDPSAGADPEGEYKSVSYPGCSFTTDHASFFSANVLGAETETEKEVEKEAEKLPGVPNTGLGGTSSILYKYIGWIR